MMHCMCPAVGKDGKALWPDIITTHHQKYYGGGANDAPTDWEKPIPVNFLTATGKFLIALSGDENWVQAGFEILSKALAELGIGAKTSSGYGRILFGNLEMDQMNSQESYEVASNRLLKKETPSPGYRRG